MLKGLAYALDIDLRYGVSECLLAIEGTTTSRLKARISTCEVETVVNDLRFIKLAIW